MFYLSEELIKAATKDCHLDLALRGRTFEVELCYPDVDEVRPNAVLVGLCAVAAVDSILIKYDNLRYGWQILQATRFSWEEYEVCDPGWVEAAFIPAWDKKVLGPGDDEYIWKEDRK